MPLHLLGKKSWNVYNPENIARVKQDEAAAQAREKDEERHQRDHEAASRLSALRGESVPDTIDSSSRSRSALSSDDRSRGLARKRRKLAGEDDTDRDIRLARADRDATTSVPLNSDIYDPNGHIKLVSENADSKRSQGRPQQEEPVGMRFKDATGYKSDGMPWYTSKSADRSSILEMNKDVWGNDDPRRREREQHRMSASDPLAAMKKGVKQLRENEKQRQEWLAQREGDLYEVERLAREERKKKRRRHGDDDSLDGFSLDTIPHASDRHSDEEARHSRDKHRSRSPDRRHRHRRHHRDRPRHQTNVE